MAASTVSLLLLLAFVCSPISGDVISHYGLEFYLGILKGYSGEHNFKVTLDIVSKSPGDLFINVPFLHINRTQTLPQGVTTIQLDTSLVKMGTYLENRGIYLKTTRQVSVYVTNYYAGALDSYLALPVEALGQRYATTSYKPYDGGERSEFMVVGVYDNTSVTIHVSGGSVIHQKLNRLQAYQYSSPTDMTGSTIDSDKPVSVFTGATCAGSHQYCDALSEQLFPLNVLDNAYILPALHGLDNLFVRNIYDKSNHVQNICINGACKTPTSNYEETALSMAPTVVTGDSAFQAIEYAWASNAIAMAIVPGVAKYISDYYFAIPDDYTTCTNYFAITVPTANINTLVLDGSALPSSDKVHEYAVPAPYDNYTVLIYKTQIGFHHMENTDGAPFGLLCYGHCRISYYSFPAGASFGLLGNGECGDAPWIMNGEAVYTSGTSYGDEVIYSCELGFILQGSNSMRCDAFGKWAGTVPVCVQQVIDTNQMCFTCDDMVSPSLCDTVKRCQEGEVCFLQKYLREGKYPMYSSGCLDGSMCSMRQNSTMLQADECFECCQSNYCNNQGCGEQGLAPLGSRGPLCFDCQHATSPEDCHYVQLCHHDQICGIEKIEWGDSSHYKMACTSPVCGPLLHQSMGGRAARATPVCRGCCGGDFCNRNCTTSSTGVIVG